MCHCSRPAYCDFVINALYILLEFNAPERLAHTVNHRHFMAQPIGPFIRRIMAALLRKQPNLEPHRKASLRQANSHNRSLESLRKEVLALPISTRNRPVSPRRGRDLRRHGDGISRRGHC